MAVSFGCFFYTKDISGSAVCTIVRTSETSPFTNLSGIPQLAAFEMLRRLLFSE